MAKPEHFRYECCQQMLVATSQLDELKLNISTQPIRRKGFGHVLVVTLTKLDGRIVGSCRHEVDQPNALHWIDYITSLSGLILYH